ncbi:MAG: DNA polymerase IV [Candidatus Nanohaloarchaea archaeon]|nr:DNA polymerase IV [Candidatus Nanohaloarchaea archaeon]
MGQDRRRIIHVDMDAFFASIEQKRRDLEGEPVVVCVYSGRSDDSGAVSTASYAARELGIAAGMPIVRAKELASASDGEVHFVPMEKQVYREVSDEIRERVLQSRADAVEQASIDEAYLDVSGCTSSFKEAVDLALEVQDAVEQRSGLTCSVGVAPSKLVAKIASDQDKPAGLTVVRPERVEAFLRGLKLQEIHGIGEETVDELEELGITSVDELADADPSRLTDRFGERRGLKLWQKARGEDGSQVEERDPEQLSRLTTLAHDSADGEMIRAALEDLADDLHDRLEERELLYGRVSFLAIDTGLEMHTRSTTLPSPVAARDILTEHAVDLMHAFMRGFDGQLRRVGVRASDLTRSAGQRSLDAFASG